MNIVRSAIAVSAAAAVALMPAAAHADTKSHLDPSGDVRSVAYDASTDNIVESPSSPEATAKLGDITKIKVAHTAGTITFTVHFRDLSKAGFAHLHELAIVTPTRVRYVNVVAGPGHWKGKAYMAKRPNGRKISCSIAHHIDYGHNTVVAKVPRSCLGRPSVVKVGVETFIGYGSKVFYDQGYKSGGEFNDLLTPSPRIHR